MNFYKYLTNVHLELNYTKNLKKSKSFKQGRIKTLYSYFYEGLSGANSLGVTKRVNWDSIII